MARTIWKFEVEVTDRARVAIPKHGHIISTAFQGSELCVWAMVDPAQPVESRVLRIIGTGHPITEGDGVMRFIGTAHHPQQLVFHVFEPED